MDFWINFLFLIIGAEIVLISKEFFILFKDNKNLEVIKIIQQDFENYKQQNLNLSKEIAEKNKIIEGLNFLWNKSLAEIETLKIENKKAEKQMLHLAQKSLQAEQYKGDLTISYWPNTLSNDTKTRVDQLDSAI